MAALIPGMEGITINFASYISQIAYWVGIGLASLGSLAVLYIIYHMQSFKIKATVFPLYGSGKDGVFSFGKPRKNRIKWVNKKTAWRSLWPLFNKIDREPFDSEYIYPGNRIYVFALNDEWSPGRLNVFKTIKQAFVKDKPTTEKLNDDWKPVNIDLNNEEVIRGSINTVPHYIRNWQSLTHKKLNLEFAQESFWEKNKMVITTMVCCLFILVACIATIYFAYKFSTGSVQSSTALADAIKNFGTIAGK